MKNIVIIEDESVAAEHLIRLIADVLPESRVTAVLQSIEESVEYFGGTPQADLVFMDIHLADGSAFRIFDQTSVPCPVVFTTAYDRYALEAFRVGGIDYLLKPISRDDLQHAINKLSLVHQHQPADNWQPATGNTHYKSHLLVPVADKLVPLDLSRVACFYLEDKVTYAICYDGFRLAMDRPLDALMSDLDPRHFYRANRQYVVAHDAIAEIALWPIGKLALTLKVHGAGRIIVSKQKSPDFKQWYTA